MSESDNRLAREITASEAVASISRQLLKTEFSIDEIASLVLDASKLLTDSEHGFVSSIDPATKDNIGHTLTDMMGSACRMDPAENRIAFPVGPDGRYGGLWGHALNARAAFFTNTPAEHESSKGIPEGHIKLENFMAVPCLAEQELIGEIALSNSRRDYNEADLANIRKLADIFALAVKRYRNIEDLKTSRENLLQAQRLARVGSYEWDVPGGSIEWSDEMYKIFGLTRENHTPTVENFGELVHPDDEYILSEEFAKGALSLPVHKMSFRIIKQSSGETRFIKLRGIVTHDSSGAPLHVSGVMQDITEETVAAEILRTSEEKYRAVLESAAEGILITELQTKKIAYANPAICSMLGYTDEELTQLTLRELHPEDELDRIVIATVAHENSRYSSATDIPFLRKDGSILHADLRTTVMKIDGLLCTTSFITDTTDRKLAELQKEQLQQADKMVSLGTLVSGVAHEINNPNNFVMLNAPLLSDTWLSILPILDAYYEENGDFSAGGLDYSEIRSEIVPLFDAIKEGAHRIKNIVNDLKSYAVIDVESTFEEIDINDPLRSAITLVSSEIKKSTNHFTCDYAADLPKIDGHAQKLEQVFINLIINACHALPDDSKAVAIRTFIKNDKVCMEVRDEGTGISTDNIKRITDPFFTTKRAKGGTGLGLAVSAGIIRDHGGTMSFESEINSGTTATVAIPLRNRKDSD